MEDRKKVTERTLPEVLGAYNGKHSARFHMPGHKGRGMSGFWRGELIGWDVTELSGTDNLHQPNGAILRAQQNMAAAYGAKASFLIVNGSTAAVQAMILALSPSDKLLLSRDAHRSAASGAALRGIPVSYLWPEYDEITDLSGMVTPEKLDRALTGTGATAVLITSPNYMGFCADIPALAQVAHAHHALLMVDAAHGAHYPFSDLLPGGLAGYADLWAHSQHKTMDALTQAASLHLGECRISPEQLQRVLAMIETTSPSYLLMASLDWSVYMASRQNWSGQVYRMEKLRERIAKIPGMALLPRHIGIGVYDRDRTRLIVDVTGRGLTGFAAAALLEEVGVYVEMADARRLVLITSPEDDPNWYEQLLLALDGLPERTMTDALQADARRRKVMLSEQPETRLCPRDAVFGKLVPIPLSEATGRVAGEAIGVYPPGVALVMPGEVITKNTILYLQEEERTGATLFGVRNGRIFVVA